MNSFDINFDIFSPEELSKIIETCNQLFYNQSRAKNLDNLTLHIKSVIAESFTDFFGQKHKDTISKRIDDCNIVYIYSILGRRNSIESYLKNEKAREFAFRTKINISNPEMIVFVSQKLKQNNNTIVISKIGLSSYFNEVAKALGYKESDLSDNSAKKDVFIKEVHMLADLWKNMPYSDNASENKTMMELQSVVDRYKQGIFDQFIKEGYTKEQASRAYNNLVVDHPQFLIDSDPVCNKLTESLPSSIARRASQRMIINNRAIAFHIQTMSDKSYVFLGINPSDNTILHEMIHVVDLTGFEKDNSFLRQPTSKITNQVFRKYEALNEVITEYFAQKIFGRRLDQGKLPIVTHSMDRSGYAPMIELLMPFIQTYEQELKDTRFAVDPVYEFKKVIGDKEFEELAESTSDTLTLHTRRNIIDLQKMYKDEKESLRNLVTHIARKKENKLPVIESVQPSPEGMQELLELIIDGTQTKDIKKSEAQNLASSIKATHGIVSDLSKKQNTQITPNQSLKELEDILKMLGD